MDMITLPLTDLRVSRICLGTMQLAGSIEAGSCDVTWGAVDAATATATVLAALDCGINFFDCAEAYGADRQAERALGAALAASGRRDEAVIASKFGTHVALWETEDPTGEQRRYDGAAVAAALDATLVALQTDHVDLFQVHWPGNIGVVGDEAACRAAGTWDAVLLPAVRALQEGVRSGKARYWGVCNFGAADLAVLDAALAELAAAAAAAGEGAAGAVPSPAGAGYVSNQLPYNCLWRAVEAATLPACAQRGIGVLCYSPLQQGLLAGKARVAADVADGRRRTRLYGPSASDKARHGEAGLEEQLFGGGGVLAALRDVCETQGGVGGCTMVDAATAFLLAQPAVSAVLVGASKPEQVRRNAELVGVRAATEAGVVQAVAAATEALRLELLQRGNVIDQYARVSRIRD